jgi:electron transfer flavoprotein alpha/beta subunit
MIFALIEDARDLPLVSIGRGLGEVFALSVGPPPDADDPLARALALGATRAARVWEPALAGVDYLGIAHVLACAVRQLAERTAPADGTAVVVPVVVLAADRGRGAIGPALAERLAVPHLGAVHGIEIADGQIVVERLCGDELRRFCGSPPAVLVCAVDAVHVVAATAATDGRQVERLDLAMLQITAPELLYRRRFRPTAGATSMRRPHVVSNVEVLSDRLARDGLWPVPEGD